MTQQEGFSLIEFMIVVAIIGILSVIAVTAYTDYITRGRLVDATAGLSSGRITFEQHYQDAHTYATATCPAATEHFTYNCGTPTATTYTLTATGMGSLSTFSYTINEANIRTSATPWGNGATCWIMKPGDTC